MKKKGFTLIELLAVIVILAIIALIATPLVLKYIENSRKESKVDSAYSFVRNLETEMANYALSHSGNRYSSGEKIISELSDLNTKVKGDNPTDGKVCISSVGQIEKGMFEFNDGKYYVNYNGKKANISDKDTFDNFSCDGNKTFILKNALLTVREDQYTYNNFGVIDELDSTTFYDNLSKNPDICEYSLIIKDKNTGNNIYQTDLFYTEWGDAQELYAYSNSLELYCNTEICKIGPNGRRSFLDDITEGDYYVDLVLSDRDFIPYSFKIDGEGASWLNGTIFVDGDANILITDADGKEYFNGTVQFAGYVEEYGGVVPGGEIVSIRSTGMGQLLEVYNAIANGKIITIRITQTVDGKDVVTTIVGNNPVLIKDGSPWSGTDVYALGNELWPIAA